VVDEQPRIAAEFADALIRRLYAAGYELHRFLLLVDNAEVSEHFELAVGLLNEAIQMIQAAAANLPPPN